VVNIAHLRRVVSAKARGARGAGWAGETRLSGDSIIARRTSRTPVSLGAVRSLCWLDVSRPLGSIGADGAALSVGDDGIGAVRRVLTDHLVAHDGAAVADADLAGFWFPHILVVVQLPVKLAVDERAIVLALTSRQKHSGAEQER